MGRVPGLRVLGLATLVLASCGGGAGEVSEATPAQPAVSKITAWGEIFEVQAEIGPLVAGEPAVVRLTVTTLADFAPLTEGAVEVVFAGREGGSPENWSQSAPLRPGVFELELDPLGEGERELSLRVRSAAGEEVLRGGRVRVGRAGAPGRIVVAPAPRGGTANAQPVTLLKDQQWSSDFSTAWVRPGRLARGVRALGQVRPVAGGEVTLTAPVRALALPRPWPHLGQTLAPGSIVVRLSPLVAEQASLAELRAEVRRLESQRRVAESNALRQQQLFGSGVTSRRDAEEAGAELESLTASLEGARHDLDSATAAREGRLDEREDTAVLSLTAPFGGRVASLGVSPGEAVDAGQPLVRIVRTDEVWVALSLTVADADLVGARPELAGLVLRRGSRGDLRFPAEVVRFVSRSPEVDPHRGTVDVLLAVDAADRLLLGEALEAELLMASHDEGVVVPRTALVDDGGVPVVYLQLAAESFVRQPVTVVRRQGELALVDGLVPGQRLVTSGGDVIRRTVLLQSGGSHGHVH